MVEGRNRTEKVLVVCILLLHLLPVIWWCSVSIPKPKVRSTVSKAESTNFQSSSS
jgi:hypothetical protein